MNRRPILYNTGFVGRTQNIALKNEHGMLKPVQRTGRMKDIAL